jgi:hypothetical protein
MNDGDGRDGKRTPEPTSQARLNPKTDEQPKSKPDRAQPKNSRLPNPITPPPTSQARTTKPPDFLPHFSTRKSFLHFRSEVVPFLRTTETPERHPSRPIQHVTFCNAFNFLITLLTSKHRTAADRKRKTTEVAAQQVATDGADTEEQRTQRKDQGGNRDRATGYNL